MIIALLGLALLAGGAVAWLWSRRGYPRAVLAVVLAVVVAEQVCLPAGLGRVSLLRRAPGVYQRLATMPGTFPVVELPMGLYHRDGRLLPTGAIPEVWRLYFSALHWKKLVNGYSGFFPADYVKRVHRINRFPEPDAYEALGDLGVRYAIVHPGGYPDFMRAAVMESIATMPGVEFYDTAVLVPISREGPQRPGQHDAR